MSYHSTIRSIARRLNHSKIIIKQTHNINIQPIQLYDRISNDILNDIFLSISYIEQPHFYHLLKSNKPLHSFRLALDTQDNL